MYAFFKFLLDCGYSLIAMLPVLSFIIPADLVTDASFALSGVAYFLPMSTLVPLFVIKMTIVDIRLAIAILKFIKSFIPFISGG